MREPSPAYRLKHAGFRYWIARRARGFHAEINARHAYKELRQLLRAGWRDYSARGNGNRSARRAMDLGMKPLDITWNSHVFYGYQAMEQLMRAAHQV